MTERRTIGTRSHYESSMASCPAYFVQTAILNTPRCFAVYAVFVGCRRCLCMVGTHEALFDSSTRSRPKAEAAREVQLDIWEE